MKYKQTIIKEKKIDGEIIRIQAKEVGVSQFKVVDDEKGIFEAYVSVFGNVDSYGEIVDQGAFKEWLEQYFPRYPKGVWAHNWDEPIIKTIEIREDERGLYVKGQFVLKVQRAAEIYELMKEGVITDFSFGFRVLEDRMDPDTNLRHLTKIAIYEYSPVLVGANNQATLLGVKSDGEEGEETPTETPADTPAGEEETPSEATPEAEEQSDPNETPGANDTPAPGEETQEAAAPEVGVKAGKVLSKKNRALIESAVDSMQEATNALEALLEATEDDDSGKASDTSTVEAREGRDVVRGILRDARKADKIIEKVILRAKTVSK